MTRTIIIKIAAAAAFMAIGALLTFGFLSHHRGPDSEYSRHHNAQHRAEHMGSGGAGHEHDEINMPGLNGRDTTQQEVDDLKRLFFRQHEAIERQVPKSFHYAIFEVYERHPAQLPPPSQTVACSRSETPSSHM